MQKDKPISGQALRSDREGGQRHGPAVFPPRERDPIPIVQEAGWAQGPLWTGAGNLALHRDSIPGPCSP